MQKRIFNREARARVFVNEQNVLLSKYASTIQRDMLIDFLLLNHTQAAFLLKSSH